MLPLNVSEVSEKGNKTQIKIFGSGDSASNNASVAISSEFYIQNSIKGDGYNDPDSQTLLVRTVHKPCTFLLHRD